MKSKTLTLILLICLPFALAAQRTAALQTKKPPIAVFDAAIPKGFDSAAVIPITDSLSEELVNSGKYSVLDRAHIQVTLQEKAFKMSELVNDSEAKSAGEMLGAEFVVVIRVQDFDGTLFLSAKMINVSTGEIQAQSSSNVESRKLAKLIELAHAAGIKLAGGINETQTGPKLVETPRTVAAPEPATPREKPVAKQPAENANKPPYSHLIAGLLAPSATWGDTQLEGSAGYQIQWMQHLFWIVYAGADFSSIQSSYSGTIDIEFSELELNGILGFVLPFGQNLQIYGGLKGGVSSYTLSSPGYDDETYDPSMVGFEIGIEYSLLRIIPLVIEYQMSTATAEALTGITPAWSALMFGVGFSY